MNKNELNALKQMRESQGWELYQAELKKELDSYKDSIVKEFTGHDTLFTQTDMAKMKYLTLDELFNRLDTMIENAEVVKRNQEKLDPYHQAVEQADDIHEGKSR